MSKKKTVRKKATARKTKAKPKSKIVSLATGSEVEPDSEAEYMERLKRSMSVPDRIKFQDIEEGLAICKDTGKLSEYSKLIVLRTDLIDKYEATSDDEIEFCFDDFSVKEAANG